MFDATYLENATTGEIIILSTFILWSIIWTGFALWISAKEGKRWWFIAILFLNTAGILEIIYIFGFSGWGRNFWLKRNNKKEHKKEDQKDKDCDCTSCDGKDCDCDCHNEISE